MSQENTAKITITAVDQTKEAIKSAQDGLNRFQEAGSRLNEMLGKLLPALGGVAFTEIISQSAEAADGLEKLSQRTGITVENLNGLSFAAKLSNVDSDALAMSVQKLGKYMGQAQISGGVQAEMLKALGVTAKDPMRAMYQLSDAMKSIEDPSQRVYVATQLLGRGGAQMIPALLGGGDALRKMVEEGQRLNPVSTAFAQQSAEMNDNLKRLETSAQGTATKLGEGVVPAVTDVIKAFMSFSQETGAAKAVGDFLGETLRVVAFSAGYVVNSFKDVGNQIGFLAAEAVALAHGDFAAMKEISAARDQQAQQNEDDFVKLVGNIAGVSTATEQMGKKNTNAVLDLSKAIGTSNVSRKEANRLIKLAHVQTGLTLDQMQFEQSLIGKSAEEIKNLTGAHNADLVARKAIAGLQADDKLKDHPEEIRRVTQALLQQASAEKQLAAAKAAMDMHTQFNNQDPTAAAQAKYKKQLADLAAFHQAGLLSDESYASQRNQAEVTNQAALMTLFVQGKLSESSLDQMTWQTKLQGAAQFMQMEIGAGAQHSRALFEINKVAKLAEAAVTLPSTVMKAYDFGATWGGPIGGAAMAAIAFASQSAQMGAIASAQFGGGAAGSAPSAGGSVSPIALPGQTANPNVIAAATPAPLSAAQAAPAPRVQNVTLVGTFFDDNFMRSTLIPMINDAVADGIQLNVSLG